MFVELKIMKRQKSPSHAYTHIHAVRIVLRVGREKWRQNAKVNFTPSMTFGVACNSRHEAPARTAAKEARQTAVKLLKCQKQHFVLLVLVYVCMCVSIVRKASDKSCCKKVAISLSPAMMVSTKTTTTKVTAAVTSSFA